MVTAVAPSPYSYDPVAHAQASLPGLRRLYEFAHVSFDEAAYLKRAQERKDMYAEAAGAYERREAILAQTEASIQAMNLPEYVEPAVKVDLSPEAKAALAKDAAQKASETSGAAPTTGMPTTAAAPVETYPKGSLASENNQMAAGMAKAARNNIETLGLDISLVNGGVWMLNNTERFDDLRARGMGGEVDMMVYISEKWINTGLSWLGSTLRGMNSRFEVAGAPLYRTTEGKLRIGDFTQSAGEAGWSVSVRSTGEAVAVANGRDVSDQVDDSSAWGFRWSDVIAARKARDAALAAEPSKAAAIGTTVPASTASEAASTLAVPVSAAASTAAVALATLSNVGKTVDRSI